MPFLIALGKANRFEKPSRPDPWSDVYQATTPRDNCPQLGLEIPEKGYLSYTYSEDCLLLNVWRPIEMKTNRSVMVYIYGGGFKTGSIFKITHDARYIVMREDIIVVGLIYRLGAFGFMYGHDELAPANLGLHDQILGLNWVQENIVYFGGNPSSVTIFGNSAGSVAVSALLLSPLTRGLFHRAIIQSGVPNTNPSKEDLLSSTNSLAESLQCDNSTMQDKVKCLKNKSVDQILNATRDLGNPFTVVYGDSILPIKPTKALLSGEFNANIDLLYGITQDEGLAFSVSYFPELNDNNLALTVDMVKDYIVQLVGNKYGMEAAELYVSRANLSTNPTLDELR